MQYKNKKYNILTTKFHATKCTFFVTNTIIVGISTTSNFTVIIQIQFFFLEIDITKYVILRTRTGGLELNFNFDFDFIDSFSVRTVQLFIITISKD